MSALENTITNLPSGSAPELEAILDAADALAAARIREEALELEERARAQRFYVACLGQFKRGKSTLLDALIGVRFLPTGILPVTAVPTIVRYGPELGARIRHESEEWQDIHPLDLEAYVSEEKNPGNCKKISAVEVFLDSPLLASGMCLVDTPGLGSIFESNTQTTRAFIPHIDAAILVIGADPPLSADELSLAKTLSGHVKTLITVLNKTDKVAESERLLAKNFARLILEKNLPQFTGRFFEISATEWLDSAKPTRDAAELVRALQDLAATSGAELAQAAWRRGLGRLSLELRAIIAERRGALTRPIEDSQKRLATLQEHLNEAHSCLRDLAPLLAAEQQALERIFAQRRGDFIAQARPTVRQKLEMLIDTVPFGSGPAYRRDLMRVAQEVARESLLPWLASEQVFASELYRRTMNRFIQLAQNHLGLLGESIDGTDKLRLAVRLRATQDLTAESEFRFHQITRIALPVSPFGLVRDVVLGLVRLKQPFMLDANAFLEKLLTINSSRVENDFKERVSVSRRRLESEIRALLTDASQQAEAAMDAAEKLAAQGSEAVATELGRLLRIERSLLRSTGEESS